MPDKGNPSQIVLLGAGGFLGCAFARFFDSQGLNVLCVSRSYQWLNHSLSGKVDRIDSSVSDIERYEAYIQENACVIYMAGSTDLLTAEQHGVSDVSSHLKEMSTALGSIYATKDLYNSFLISSAGAVYGECPPAGCNESSELRPKSIYGLRNVLMEQYYKYICSSHDAPSCILRIANPYGIEQLEVRRKGLITALVLAAVSGNRIILRGNGEQARDYIYSEDLCRIVLKFIRSTKAPASPINIGSGQSFKSAELVEMVSTATKTRLNIVIEADQPPYEVRSSILSVSSDYARDILVSPAEGIRRIWNKSQDASIPAVG
jgi:UDP-glucose 4-epimerase